MECSCYAQQVSAFQQWHLSNGSLEHVSYQNGVFGAFIWSLHISLIHFCTFIIIKPILMCNL